MKKFHIPSRIDDPPHLMLWRLDDLMPAVLGLMIGIFFGKMLIWVGLGFLLTKSYKKFRDSMPDGFFFHWLYFHGLYPARAKSFVDPLCKRLFP